MKTVIALTFTDSLYYHLAKNVSFNGRKTTNHCRAVTVLEWKNEAFGLFLGIERKAWSKEN